MIALPCHYAPHADHLRCPINLQGPGDHPAGLRELPGLRQGPGKRELHAGLFGIPGPTGGAGERMLSLWAGMPERPTFAPQQAPTRATAIKQSRVRV